MSKKRHWTIRANRRIGALTSRPTSLGKVIRKRNNVRVDRRPILRNGRRPIRIDEGVDRGAATGGAGWQRHCLPLSASVSRC